MSRSSSTQRRHLIDINQAAEFYSCSTKTIRRMVARGDINAWRLGSSRLLRFDQNELEGQLRALTSATGGSR